MRVRYISSFLDRSGYGSAARDYIRAILRTKKVDLTLKAVSFEQEKTSHGLFHEETEGLLNKELDAPIQIIHLTPDNFPLHRLKSTYNIGYTVWETDVLPPGWVNYLNQMNEIWTPSQWNVEIFKNNGVTRPIFCIPHTFEDGRFSNNIAPESIADGKFLFYSIFQWIERKGPLPLLKAYFTEFKRSDNVILALKTYRLDNSEKERHAIREQIKLIKRSLNLSDYPPVLFFGDVMTYEQVQSLHKRGDCFVMTTRGEAFGIPYAESMGYGNPTIGTGFGGNLEFMNNKNSYLIDYQMTPVSGMLFNNYHGHMTWADPSVMHTRKLMREVFENPEAAKVKGLLGRQTILEDLSYEKIGGLIVKRLETICKEKGIK